MFKQDGVIRLVGSDGVIRLVGSKGYITEQIDAVSVKYLIWMANEKGTASFGLFSSLRKN